MTENEAINGWTFEEAVKTAENLMEAENNMFKWDVLRHLRDFAENFKDQLEQYRAIGTIEEFKALKEKSKPIKVKKFKKIDEVFYQCGACGRDVFIHEKHCAICGKGIDWSE